MKPMSLDGVVAVMTFQPRLENAGEEKKGASTLHFVATCPNAILDQFEPQLRAAFYRRELKTDEPADLADQGAAPEDGLVRIKFRRIDGMIEWSEEFTEYALAIDYGIAAEPPIKLSPVKVDGVMLTMRDGGSVIVKFRVAAHPNEDQAGKLYTLNGREVTIDMGPSPDPKKGQGDLIDDGKGK